MEKQGCRRRRLVLVPCPFQGHMNPMLQLGTILHSKGFSITVAHTLFNSPDPSNHPDFIFLPLSDGISSKPSVPHEFVAFMSNLNLNCRGPFLELLTQIIEKQEQHDELPCIIYDGIMYFPEAVACHLKLPSFNLHTGSVANMLTYHAYPRLQEEGHIPPQGVSSAIIWNSIDCLERSSLAQYQQQFQVPIFSIGPIHKIAPVSSCSLLEEDTSCITWLDKQRHNSVIYVSFGSIASVDAKELTEMAWGIANSKQPFLWVLRPDPVNGTEPTDWLPDDFKETVGERGCIVKWAPQQEVLAHGTAGVEFGVTVVGIQPWKV